LNFPTLLTLFRVVLVVPLAWAFEAVPIGTSQSTGAWGWVALACFLVATFTDWLDGVLARKWHQTSKLGALLDPLADKVLVAAALVGLAFRDVVPAWTVTVVLAREFLVTGLRVAIAESGGGVTPAGWWGKVKATLQMVAIALYLWPGGGLEWVAFPVYVSAIVLTVASGAEYVWNARHVFKGSTG